jgi:type II secretory pathway component GspD/PulD (secretin)
MRIALRRAAVAAGILAAAALAPAAQAQVIVTPSAVYVSNRPPVAVSVQTSAYVPDGGTVTLGGYSSVSESRSEYGPPLLGKVPYLSRGVRNVGYGRDVTSVRVTASVRVINLREEEYRQTGYRSP